VQRADYAQPFIAALREKSRTPCLFVGTTSSTRGVTEAERSAEVLAADHEALKAAIPESLEIQPILRESTARHFGVE
jgi:hypothetical protein